MGATICPEEPSAPAPVVTATHTSSRYSKQTFLALESYCASASCWRVAAVLMIAPLPGLIASLLPSIVHLNDPRSGLQNNSSALLHAYLLTVIVSFGTITQLLGATEVPSSLYSQWEVGLVSAVGSAFDIGLAYSVCHYWRFPVPFFILIIVPFWIACLGMAHVLVLRRKLWQSNIIIPAFKRYSSASNIQNIQFFIYAGLTIAFDNLGPTLQLVLVVAFPAVKYFLKVVLRYSTKKFSDLSGEVAVSTVEICATLYQALILQSSPSIWAIVILILLDVIQSLISIKIFVDQRSDTPRHQLVRDAMSILHQQKSSQSPTQPPNTYSPTMELVMDLPVLPAGSAHPTHNITVRRALEFAYQAEMLLLIEYYEVIIPIINAIFLIATYTATSTRYNPKLAMFYNNPDAVYASIQPTMLYSFLQGLSLVAMHFVMRYRYGVSAMYHLAFAIERHGRSIQGKMIAYAPLIFYFTVIHYGMDFSLKFDWTVPDTMTEPTK